MKSTIFIMMTLLFITSAQAQVSVIDINNDAFGSKATNSISTYTEMTVDITSEAENGHLDLMISSKTGGLVGIGYVDNGTVTVCDQTWLNAGTHSQRFDVTRAIVHLAETKEKALTLAVGPVLAGGSQEIQLVEDAKTNNLGALTIARMPDFAHPVAQVDQKRETEKAQPENMPAVGKLTSSAYPNPFNPETTIKMDMPKGAHVVVDIYDIRGKRVNQLHNGYFGPGQHDLVWQGKDESGRGVSSGVYFYRITAGTETQVGKVALLK